MPAKLAGWLASRAWHARLDRSVVALEGADGRKLLQGLVTADVPQLDAGPLYAAFLGAQGRVLLDAFLIGGPAGSVLLDVERAAVAPLLAHLKRYRLRSKAHARDASDEYEVLAANHDLPASGGACDGGAWVDPRLPCLGSRVLLRRENSAASWMSDSREVGPELYNMQLELLGVPNGAVALPPAEALPLEANLEHLNAVSFAKGCYLGQELTARTNFRGVVRKRLLPVVDASLPSPANTDSADCPPAFAHLPTTERSLAARLLGDHAPLATKRSMADMQLSALVPGAQLRDAQGSKVANLRHYDAARGVGLALCRLTALTSGEQLVSSDGMSLIPLRPSWWPDHIGVSPPA